ncbi:MmgE/PrpD family protein [Chloroflexota bacterium]
MEAIEKLARFIVETGFEKMPAEAATIVKHRLLDTLGAALAGSKEPVAKVITSFVKKLGGEPVAGVIGGRFRTSSPNAALANGTIGHAIDYDDSGIAQGHTAVIMLPTIFALAEELGNSGKEAIEAYVLGIETCHRISLAMPHMHLKGWHPSSVFGTMGAATAAAKLLKLNVEQTIMALGIAGSQAAGIVHNFGTMTKPFHAGNAARSGVMAAMLAKDGFTASKNILDGDAGYPRTFYGQKVDTSVIAENLGQPFAIISPSSYLKLHPCAGGTLRPTDATLYLAEKYDIKPDEVESVEVGISPVHNRYTFYTDPSTALEGKFSIQFVVAAAITDRQVGLAQFTNERVNSPEIKDLMKRVKKGVHPHWTEEWGKKDDYPALVTVKLKNGKEYSHSVEKPKGHPDVPLSWDELLVKYRDCAGRALKDSDVERSIEILADLEKLNDLKELMEIVTGR